MEDHKFIPEHLKYQLAFQNETLFKEIEKKAGYTVTPPKVEKIMGRLLFPQAPENRPYIYGCMVLSADGKMAFPDNPAGHLISKENRLDKEGALTDYWILNVCRTYADGVVLGAGTLKVPRKWTARIADPELAEARKTILGKQEEHPYPLVATLDGTDLPLDHEIFSSYPSVGIITSPAGALWLKERLGSSCTLVTRGKDFKERKEGVKIFARGEGKIPATHEIMELLRQAGIRYLLVESPSYIWHLLEEKLLDEFFLNYSCLYVGGDYVLGRTRPFNILEHPHSVLLSLGYHQGFIFTRQKLIY